MKIQIFSVISAFFAIALSGCGSDSGSSASESSSSMSSSSESSSSLSNRLDVTYADTLSSDTIQVSGKASSDAYRLFLGEYPRGTLIEIFARKLSGGHLDSFFVREEQGASLMPETFAIDAGDTIYNTRDAFARFGDTSFAAARFITTQGSGFYYVDIPQISGEKDSTFEFQITANVLSGYYAYAGDGDSVSIEPGDTLRGFFLLESAPRKAVFKFSASVGKSINVNASGKSISKIDLQKNGEVMSSGNSIDEQLLPEKKAEYALVVSPKGTPDYTTGPYAYFKIQTSSRDLGKGEYLANPDSIETVGDTLIVVREKNDAAKYYLRQEQYVWLANLEKGDSIQVSHEIEGYYSGASYPATYAILDSAGDSVASVSETRRLFVAPKKGAYYLHYVRLNSPPNSQSQILTLKTTVERFGYVTKFFFYDEEREEPLETKSVLTGDTLRFSTLALRTEPSDASNNAVWYIPCEDLYLIRSAYTESSCSNYGTEQLIGATNIAITTDPNSAGEIIRLIAQSLADPHARDTLNVFISDSGTP